jgi:hypothetical protein
MGYDLMFGFLTWVIPIALIVAALILFVRGYGGLFVTTLIFSAIAIVVLVHS